MIIIGEVFWIVSVIKLGWAALLCDIDGLCYMNTSNEGRD